MFPINLLPENLVQPFAKARMLWLYIFFMD